MLIIDNVFKVYSQKKDAPPVLCGINLSVEKCEMLALVGESGAGKSTLGRCIMGLERPDRGRVLFQGTDITGLKKKEFRPLYQKIQMIFQDPRTCLNPYMRIGELIREPLENFSNGTRSEQNRRVSEMMEKTGLQPDVTDRYPHQISGGQCQRTAIARSLILKPELLVCDEALSALDAPLQLQILKLLRRMQRQMNLTGLFITHDLVMARYLCPRIAVICKGRIVEQGMTAEIFSKPEHPCTRRLMANMLPLEASWNEAERQLL